MSHNLHRLLCAPQIPAFYLPIPKCGCTFVKNLIWRLAGNNAPDEPERIHDIEDRFARADREGFSREAVREAEVRFTVVRNPVSRFYSLYTDKVIGAGYMRYVPLRDTLMRERDLDPAPKSISAHQRNLSILAAWIGENLDRKTDIEPEAHWTPQIWRKNVIADFDLKLLTTHRLNDQLKILLGDQVEDIGKLLRELPRYESLKPFAQEEVLTKDVKSMIQDIYRDDGRIFEYARDYWRDRAPGSSSEAPTWQMYNV